MTPVKPIEGIGTPLQNEWFRLVHKGSVNEIIEQWQYFALRSKGSPTFPYALYNLISFYEEAGNLYKKRGLSKESTSLYALASEYARALAQSDAAPIWLNLSGWDAWNKLQSRRPTNIKIVNELEY